MNQQSTQETNVNRGALTASYLREVEAWLDRYDPSDITDATLAAEYMRDLLEGAKTKDRQND